MTGRNRCQNPGFPQCCGRPVAAAKRGTPQREPPCWALPSSCSPPCCWDCCWGTGSLACRASWLLPWWLGAFRSPWWDCCCDPAWGQPAGRRRYGITYDLVGTSPWPATSAPWVDAVAGLLWIPVQAGAAGCRGCGYEPGTHRPPGAVEHLVRALRFQKGSTMVSIPTTVAIQCQPT
jgi:hypothetical protein